MATIIIIWIVSGFLFYLAIIRILTETSEVDAPMMLIGAVLAVIMNLM